MHLMLGIHHTLVWNRVLKHNQGRLLQILLFGLLRGKQCWRTWRVHGIFHPFKVNNLGEMVSVMAVLTIKRARKVCLEVVVFVPPLMFIVMAPLGVLVTLVLVSPNRLVLLGVISPKSGVIIVSVFSFLFGIIQLMGQIFHIQLFKILKLLSGRWMKKFNPSVWLSLWRNNWLWRTRKWKIQIILWR
jgi:hypothetical protein